MTYVALLYSPHLDHFETDCSTTIWGSNDLAKWIEELCKHYNCAFNADDFYIVSITKMGE